MACHITQKQRPQIEPQVSAETVRQLIAKLADGLKKCVRQQMEGLRLTMAMRSTTTTTTTLRLMLASSLDMARGKMPGLVTTHRTTASAMTAPEKASSPPPAS